MGNFSIQYNFTSASIAVQVLSSDLYLGHALYSPPVWSDQLALSCVFLGAMLGMLVMGRLGDLLGRARALRLTTALVVLGCAVPACAAGLPEIAYATLCVGRFVLGVGVGGIYPLSAAHAAEEGGAAEAAGSSQRVSWAFFWQSPGVLAPYAVAILLFACFRPQPPQEWVPQFEFRLLFALGAIPALVVFLSVYNEEDENQELQDAHPYEPATATRTNIFVEIWRQPRETHRALIGTCGTWFTFDIAFYGCSVFTPAILDDICLGGARTDGKCELTLLQNAWQSVIVQSMGIPGCLLAILLMNHMGSKRLNVVGLLLLVANLVAMALVYLFSPQSHDLVFLLFCSLTFLLNFGPNLGTYVMPAVCFPSHIRSTCHGISAFAGKLGAAFGTLFFPYIASSSAGLPGVLLTQAALCFAGAIIAQWFQKHDWLYLHDEARGPRCRSFLSESSVMQVRVLHESVAQT